MNSPTLGAAAGHEPLKSEESPARVLELEQALEYLFEQVLSSLQNLHRFGTDTSPQFFVLYAHKNKEVGNAKDEIVRRLIAHFKTLRCKVYADQSLRGLPAFSSTPATVNEDAINDILPNQLRVLPKNFNKLEPMDKVVIFRSEVLEKYHVDSLADKASLATFAQRIYSAYLRARDVGRQLDDLDSFENSDNRKALEMFEEDVRSFIKQVYKLPHFHHVLTELAFLDIRFQDGPKNGIIDVQLNGSRNHIYIPSREEDRLYLLSKYDSKSASGKTIHPCQHVHNLFFRLLHKIYPTEQNYVDAFAGLYKTCSEQIVNGSIPRTLVDITFHFKAADVQTKQKILDHIHEEIHKQDSEPKMIKDILAWIQSGAINSNERHAKAQSDRHAETAQWIFQDPAFRGWIEGRKSGDGEQPLLQALWCSGPLGAGKTVLMASIVDYLQRTFTPLDPVEIPTAGLVQHNVAICYAYCDYENRVKETDAAVISSFVFQALSQYYERSGKIPAFVSRVFLSNILGPDKLSLEEGKNMLKKLLNDHFDKSFILLDAHDEHGNPLTKCRLLEALENVLQSCGSKCRLLVTSREDPKPKQFQSYPAIIKIRATPEDLRHYLVTAIEDFDLYDDMKLKANLVDEITSTLIKNADGLFLLPQLHLEHLKSSTNIKMLRRELNVLPVTVFDTYEEAMTRLEESFGKEKEGYKAAIRTLGWISSAIVPFTVQQLQHAYAVDETDTAFDDEGITHPDQLFRNLTSLVTVEQSTVNFAHRSVREFFDGAGKYWEKLKPDEDIVMTCLRYMTFTDFANPSPDETKVTDLFSQFPFLQYAGKYWGKHATRIKSPSPQLKQKITDFIDPQKMPLGALEVILAVNGVTNIKNASRIPKIAENSCIFHLAIITGLEDIVVEMLKNQSPEVNHRDHKNENALHIATRIGSKKMVELLLKNQTKEYVTATNTSGKNPFSIIMGSPWQRIEFKSFNIQGYITWIIDEREKAGAETLERGDDANAISNVLLQRKIQIARLSMSILNSFTRTQYFHRNTSELLTNLLLASNPTIAFSRESIEIAKLLVEHGSDVNSICNGVATPLQLAVLYDCKELVDYFLRHGANPFLLFDLGYTALELAEKKELQEIAGILRAAMEKINAEESQAESDMEKSALPGRTQAALLDKVEFYPNAGVLVPMNSPSTTQQTESTRDLGSKTPTKQTISSKIVTPPIARESESGSVLGIQWPHSSKSTEGVEQPIAGTETPLGISLLCSSDEQPSVPGQHAEQEPTMEQHVPETMPVPPTTQVEFPPSDADDGMPRSGKNHKKNKAKKERRKQQRQRKIEANEKAEGCNVGEGEI